MTYTLTEDQALALRNYLEHEFDYFAEEVGDLEANQILEALGADPE